MLGPTCPRIRKPPQWASFASSSGCRSIATCDTESAMTTSPTIRVQRLLPAAQLPRYAHTGPFGDLAADLFAAEALTLARAGEPGSIGAVRTGLALELPSTHGALVEDRSGLALRGLTTLA